MKMNKQATQQQQAKPAQAPKLPAGQLNVPPAKFIGHDAEGFAIYRNVQL
jgi:hypothetical protein